MTPITSSPTTMGTASMDSRRSSSVPGIVTANSTSRASGVSRDSRRCGDGAGDALTQHRDELVVGLAGVLGGELAPEGDGPERDPVRQHQVHAAVVVVDDGVELGGDRVADLLGVAQGVQLGAQAVEHVELRDGPIVFVADARCLISSLRHPVASRRARSVQPSVERTHRLTVAGPQEAFRREGWRA